MGSRSVELGYDLRQLAPCVVAQLDPTPSPKRDKGDKSAEVEDLSSLVGARAALRGHAPAGVDIEDDLAAVIEHLFGLP